jgi:DNA topoisomerase IB
MLFTVEQLNAIKEIIKDYHDAFILNAIDDKALPEEIVNRLKEKGLIDPQVNSIQDAYLYGQILSMLETKQVADMSYQQFKDYVRKNPIPLTVAEKQAVKMAVMHAGQFCQGLGNKVGATVGSDLIEADSKLRARLETDIRTATAENIVKRETVKQLKTDLGWKTRDWARDWDRIAVTEKQTAMQEGVADGIRKEHGGEAYVSKIPQPDACKYCLKLHIGPDGHPRIFKLSTLEANGTNFGKKAADWQAVVGTVHPHCQCQLVRVPKGWGYDEEGILVPGGKGGKHYESEKDVTKALQLEEALRKSIRENRKIVFQGLPIIIEQPVGSTRQWKTPEGETGETKFLIAYGYIDGTQGMDGDEIDVFVGPDPSAENVYVIEQQNRNTGTYDEQKCMLGFANEREAEIAYRNHYDNPDEFIICTEVMTSAHFKQWIDNTKPKSGEMGKSEIRFVLPVEDSLLKAGKVGGKYIRRVPYTDKNGKRRYRYFYAESAIARDVKAGETIRLGGDLIQVEKVDPNGTVHLRSRDQTLVVKGHQWATFVSTFYGQAYYQWAEKRALQSVNAVLQHVPREMLGELKGATDKARLADLKKRVPDVYAKLQKSFARAGVNPFRAKEVIGASLERKGWEPEARAAVIGDVITKRNQDYRTTIRAAENLAGGKIVKLGHVAAVTEISREIRAPEPEPVKEPVRKPAKGKKRAKEKPKEAKPTKDPIAEVAAKAEKEIAKLSALLEQARESGTAEDAAQTLATALSSTAIQKLSMISKAFPGLADKAVEPAKEIMLQVPSVATTSEPKAVGSSTTVYVAGDSGQAKGLTARYKLMEADDAIASHDPRSFNQRKDYPEGVQERAYHRDKMEQAKVQRNAQKLSPQFVVNTNPDAVNGPPIMSADGVVLGGNSRTMSMQLAYAKHPEKADELRAYLTEHAHEAGFSAEDVKQFKNPILVRVIDEGGQTKEEKQLLVRQMNETFTQSMDPRTMQVAMGRKLTDRAVEALGDAMDPDETLGAFLGTKRADSFITELRNVGLIDQRNANQYFDKDGKMNADGKTLVSRVLVGRAIGDADLLSATKPSIIENLAQSVPYMAQAQKFGKGYDLGDDVKVALDAYNYLQNQIDRGTAKALKPDMPSQDFRNLFAQKGIAVVEGEAHPVTQNQRAMGLLEVMIRRPGKNQTSKLFKDYAAVAAENPEGQAGLLAAARTPTEVFNDVVQRHLVKTKGTKKAKPPETPEQETAGSLFKAGPYIGPRGGKWADPQHTIPWAENKKPFLSTLILAEEAHDELNPFVSDWVFRNDGKAKTKLFEHYRNLPKANKQALDAEMKYVVNKLHGSDYVTVYRSMRPGDNSLGGMSVSTDRTTRSGNDVRAFKVHHSDILLHWGQEESWLSSKTFKHEKELILKESAKPEPIDQSLKKAGGPFYGPRGGKWADAAHTIPWKEEKKKPKRTQKQEAHPDQLTLDWSGEKIPVKKEKPKKEKVKPEGFDLWGTKINKNTINKIRQDMRLMTKAYKSIEIPVWGDEGIDPVQFAKEFDKHRRYFGTFVNTLNDWAVNRLLHPKDKSITATEIRTAFWDVKLATEGMFPLRYSDVEGDYVPGEWDMKNNGPKALQRLQRAVRNALQITERYIEDKAGEIELPRETYTFNQGKVNYVVHSRSSEGWVEERVTNALSTVRKVQNELESLGLGKALDGLEVHIHNEGAETVGLATGERSGPGAFVSGWYVAAKDRLRLFPLGLDAKEHGTLVHELGHRMYWKQLDPKAVNQWEKEINSNRIRLSPRLLDQFFSKFIEGNDDDFIDSDKIRNKVKADQTAFKSLWEYLATELPQRGNNMTIKAVKDFYKRFPDLFTQGHISKEFVTNYANTNPSEMFAEVFKLYVTKGPGAVPPWTRQQFREVLRSGGIKLTKSLEDENDLEKAGGPFIGPKGGKWADPQHTIPWEEGVGPRTKKQEDVPKPKRKQVGEAAKPTKQKQGEAPKPKKAPPGSQLPEETLKKLVELKCSKLPQADIPVADIKVDLEGDTDSKALIVWKDTKGAIQSGYTPAFHEKNAQEKWKRVAKFRDKVPEVLKTFEDKLNTAKQGSMEHQGALLGSIIAHTGLRPGSEKSAKKHEHYGVSTLRPEHVTIIDDKVNFDFIGKSGKRNTATIQDATIAKVMQGYLKGKKEGEPIFQSDRVVKTAGKFMPKGMKLKDMRTIKATQTAAKLLDAIPIPPPLTGNKAKDKLLLARAIKEVSERVAEVLNNTPAIARESYIHPEVIQYWAIHKAQADKSLFTEV